MAIAFVLIHCVLGKEDKIIENLKDIDAVKYAQKIFGPYDIIVKIENDSMKIHESIKRVKKIDRIKTTHTMFKTM